MGMYADVCGTEVKIDRHLAECIRTIRGLEPTAFLTYDGVVDLYRSEVVQLVATMSPHHHAHGPLQSWLNWTAKEGISFA
mgnify:CR=1 FL=1